MRIATARFEDCGSCLQMAVNVARQDKVCPPVLLALIENDLSALPAETALACEFAGAVLARDAQAEKLREELRARLGDAVLAELSLAISAVRVFPTLKRALGYDSHCARPFVRAAAD